MTRKLLVLIGLVVGASSLGLAGTCGVGTMAGYMVAGFSCTIADMTFSGFSYTDSAFGGATAVPASAVTVTPETGAAPGFQFGASWVAGTNQGVDSAIIYTATVASGDNIDDLELQMENFSFLNTGDVAVAESTVSPPLSLLVFSNKTGTVARDVLGIANVSSLTVTKDISVQGHATGTAQLSDVINEYSRTSQRGIVPEPASMLLLGSGLVGLAGFVRQRRAGRSA